MCLAKFSLRGRRNKEANCKGSNRSTVFMTVARKNLAKYGQKCENKCCGEFTLKNVKFCPKRPVV